jgi:hypothetical protein
MGHRALPFNCAKRHGQLCQSDAFGTIFQPVRKQEKEKSDLCLQGFHVVFEMTAPLLHWNREQTTNF